MGGCREEEFGPQDSECLVVTVGRKEVFIGLLSSHLQDIRIVVYSSYKCLSAVCIIYFIY